MEKVYARTKGIRDDMVSGFCPGCMHSTVIRYKAPQPVCRPAAAFVPIGFYILFRGHSAAGKIKHLESRVARHILTPRILIKIVIARIAVFITRFMLA